MFYVKTIIGEFTTIRTEITNENVFTRCPHCGEEIPVNLQEQFAAGDFDLCGTAIFCGNCAELARREGKDLLALMSEHFPEEVYD